MRFLDTDAILRFLTRDDEQKASRVLSLLRRVAKNEETLVVSPLVVFEVVFTLQSYYKVPRDETRRLVLSILNLKGLRLSDRDVFVRALDDYCDMGIPFADAFNANYMRSHKIEEIYSYDRDYDRIDGVKRVKP